MLTTSPSVSALTGALLASDCIAKAKKSFILHEDLILPAAKDIYCKLLGEPVVQKMVCVPFLVSTTIRPIDKTAEDIEVQLLED